MTETITRAQPEPLQGAEVPMIGVTNIDGMPTLRWRPHFIELGQHQRLETELHERMPGIAVVRAYFACDPNLFNEKPPYTPTLEEAKENDSKPFLFLISRAVSDTVVVSSKIPYTDAQKVQVKKPKYPTPGVPPKLDVRLRNYPRANSEDQLVGLHSRRTKRFGIDLHRPVEPRLVEGIYLYMTQD